MAEEFPSIIPPEDTGADYTDLFDGGQWDNMVIGINRGVDGFKQALDEVKETLGLVPEGTAEFKTQETKKEQRILREAAFDDQQLTGAAGFEFAGESLPLFAVPLGATVPRAAALGGLATSGFFQEDVNDSRLDDIALGAATGGLFRMLFRGSKAGPRGGSAGEDARNAVRQADANLQQKLLPAPAQRQGQKLLTDQRQLALPAPAPKAHSPQASLTARGLSADDFQLAGRDALQRTGAAPVSPLRTNPARKALENFRSKVSPKAAQAAVRKAEVFARNAARKAKKLEELIARGGPARRLTKLQQKLTSALYDKIAANAMLKGIAGRATAKDLQKVGSSKALTPVESPARVQPTVAPTKDTRASLIKEIKKANPAAKNLGKMKLDDLKQARDGLKGPGGNQGGFAESDLVNTLGGAAIGGLGAGVISDGDPLAIAAGALGGGFGVRALGRRLDKVTTKKQRDAMRAASEQGGNYNEQVSRAAKARDFSKETIASVLQNGRKTVDSFLGATMRRLENLSPRVAVALKEAEFQQHYHAGQWIGRGDELFKRIENANLTDAQRMQYKISLLNSTKNARAYLSSIGKTDAADAIAEFDALLKDVGGYLNGVDLGHNLRANYFPRTVKDLEAFPKAIQQEVNTYLEQLAKKKGIKLTDFEKEIAITEVINGALTRGPDQVHFGRAASNLQRRTNKVDRTNVAAYADPHEAFNDYIESITTQVERRRFFKGQGVKVDDLGPNAENIETVAGRLAEQLKKGDLGPDEVDEVAQLIRMRFGPGEQAPHKAVQNFKNLTYTGLLGNPLSAATQFGDLALSMHRNGIANTVRGVLSDIGGKGKLSGLDKETLLGIRNAAADFASRTPTRDLLNWSLKWSGFQRVDRLGKNSFIRAAMMKNQQMDKASFNAKWKSIFDPDAPPGGPTPRTDQLFEQVKTFDGLTDANREDLGFMLWNELSDVQPIALSALPEQYLANPNGRMAYMLQSFTLKLFDVMRKDIYQQMAQGNRVQAAKNATKLSTLFVANNGTVDMFKDFMLNRESTVPDTIVDNYLKLLGMNKFMVGQIEREGLGSAILKTVAPPTVLFDALTDPKEALKLAPPVGKLIEGRIE
jgi:hypothetical protein